MKIVAVITGMVGAAAVLVPLCTMLITTPAFTRLAEENANQESVQVASHLANSFPSRERIIASRNLPTDLPAEAGTAHI